MAQCGVTDLPCITPTFSITTGEKGSNHSIAFAEAAKTEEAHEATLTVSKCLAAIAVRVLTDEAFFAKASPHICYYCA